MLTIMVMALPLGVFILVLAWLIDGVFGGAAWLWWVAWVFIGAGVLSATRAWRRRRWQNPRRSWIRVDSPPPPVVDENPYMD